MENKKTSVAAIDSKMVDAARGEAGLHVAGVAENARIRAAFEMALIAPRDQDRFESELRNLCTKPSFANIAVYSAPLAGKDKPPITGYSVEFARDLRQLLGHVMSGQRVLSADDMWIHIQGWAYDVQKNNFVAHEDKIKKLIKRGQNWMQPSEHQLMALTRGRGARLERNAILDLAPRWLLAELRDVIEQTQRKCVERADGANKPSERAISTMLQRFSELDPPVGEAEIAAYLGHPVQDTTAEEVAALRRIFVGISKEGVHPSEVFDVPGPDAVDAFGPDSDDALKDLMGG